MPVGSGYSKHSSSYVGPKRDCHSLTDSFSASSKAVGSGGPNGANSSSSSSSSGRQVFSLIANQDTPSISNTTLNSQQGQISSQQKKATKTVLVVKCTDSSINAFNQVIANQRQKGVPVPSVSFKKGGGSLNLPLQNADGGFSMRGLNFKLSKLDQAAGLECLLQRSTPGKNQCSNRIRGEVKDKQLTSIGDITQTARIEGTDEIFQQTKQRMSQVEQDYKKISTKTIDNFGKNKLSGVTKKKSALDLKPNRMLVEAASLASRPSMAPKHTISNSHDSNKFGPRSEDSLLSVRNKSSFSHQSTGSRNSSANSSPQNPSFASSTFQPPGRQSMMPESSSILSEGSVPAKGPNNSLNNHRIISGNTNTRDLSLDRSRHSISPPIPKLGSERVADEPRRTLSEASRVSTNSNSNSNSPKSATSETSSQYSLKDHILHLLAVEDGITVSSVVFRLKSQCKLKGVQHSHVLSLLNQVATNENRAANVYSLRGSPDLVQLVASEQIKPQQYPFYTQSQRHILAKKLDRLNNLASQDNHVPTTRFSSPYEPADDISVSPVALSAPSTSPFNPSHSRTQSHSEEHPNPKHNHQHHQPQSLSASSQRSSDTLSSSSGNLRREAKQEHQRSSKSEVPDCFRNLIENTSTQRKRQIESSDSSNAKEHIKEEHIKSRSLSAHSSNSDQKRFRPSLESNSNHSQSHQQNATTNESTRKETEKIHLNAPHALHATQQNAAGFNKQANQGNSKQLEDVVTVEPNLMTVTGQNGLEFESVKSGKQLVFSHCLANCKYCIEDPLKDFAELKSEISAVTSRDEYFVMHEKFKQDYSVEFQPLRRKVTETKKLFKQLKDDFEAAKVQYSKLADDEANKAQLEQMANNVIKEHERLFCQEDFLKTNHRCCQLHNQLSVVLSRLQEFRNHEIHRITQKHVGMKAAATHKITATNPNGQSPKPPPTSGASANFSNRANFVFNNATAANNASNPRAKQTIKT